MTLVDPRRLEGLADDLDGLSGNAGVDLRGVTALTDVAELLRRLAAGDLEVLRCECETYGSRMCPTCSPLYAEETRR